MTDHNKTAPCERRMWRRLHIAAGVLLFIPLCMFIALCVGIATQKVTTEIYNKFYPRKYIALVELASERWNVPESVIYGVIHTESGFDEDAVSRANAVGLMQLTEDTYEWVYFLRREECPEGTIMMPAYNIDAGVYLLSWLYERYGNWDTVYAAYNAGFSRVNGWLEDPEIAENGVLVNIPITETRAYVERCAEAEEIYRTLYFEENG